MAFEDENQVIAFIKEHLTEDKWVKDARENHKVLKALVFGKDFTKVLIKKIEKIESTARQTARKKYSKDIRDMFDRVMQPRQNIFTASGGSVTEDLTGQNKDKFIKSITHFKGQKSLKKYLAENFFHLVDVDPNGLLFLEYVEDEDIFPTYKSINDIRWYRSDGQLVDKLLFEPIVSPEDDGAHEWRVVDRKKDWRIKQKGTSWTLIEDKTFEHPFGRVPATILSDHQKMGSETRISPLFPVEELAKDYARDKSILTIYKFQHGFPRHWRYDPKCRPCQGTGKTGEEKCEHCEGKGSLRINDVTDVTTLDFPREDDQIVTPDLEGFVSPDLETWDQYNTDLKSAELRIADTMWGTERVRDGGNETATGRFIDVQPVINKLGTFTDNVEWTHNKIADFVENWVNGSPVDQTQFHITYGRRFIIESADSILDKYNESRKDGANNTILDKLLDTYILAQYQANPILLMEMQKKRLVEPYIHQGIKEVNEIFGAVEANKIVLFVDFWEEADATEPVETLKAEFEKFVQADSETKGLTDIEITRKLLSQAKADVAAAALAVMSRQQVLKLFNLKPDGSVELPE